MTTRHSGDRRWGRPTTKRARKTATVHRRSRAKMVALSRRSRMAVAAHVTAKHDGALRRLAKR